MLKSLNLTVKQYCDIYLAHHYEIIDESLSLNTIITVRIPISDYEVISKQIEFNKEEEEFSLI